jgi:tRNA G10  N-methylase Trm11
VADWMVRPFAVPGALMIDPFAGSGALVEAAAGCGMEAVGYEKDTSPFSSPERQP